MKITVAVPTFNADRYLDNCLHSIVSQPANVDLIVQDAGSTDNTHQIARKYGARLFIEIDKGEPDAINKAFAKSSGDILAWLDADDVYQPGALALVEKYFSEHPGCMWLYGKCKVIDSEGRETRQTITRIKEVFQPRYSYQALLLLDFIAQPACFFRRSVFDVLGALDITEKMVFDYEYWLRLGAKYRPGFINEYLACWRAHEGSSCVRDTKRDADDMLRLAKRYKCWPHIRLGQYAVYAGMLGYYALFGKVNG